MTLRNYIISGIFGFIAFLCLVDGWKLIETGNVGVKKTLGSINPDEMTPGFSLKIPLFTGVTEFVGKEISIDLKNLTPKASDNLTIRDMDVTIFYRVATNKIADMRIKYSASHIDSDAGYLPVYNLVLSEARSATYKAIASISSLEMHRKRTEAALQIKLGLQKRLDKKDAETIFITRVIIRSVITDPSIEKSIQKAVANQKRLEAKKIQVAIAKKDAEIEIERAKGIAKANAIINKSLTREYLQHELNNALMKFAKSGKANTIVIPANMRGLSLITPTR